MATSSRVGQKFSINGDFLAFTYDGAQIVDDMADPPNARGPAPVGPCIASVADFRRAERPVQDGFVVEVAL